MAPELSSNWKKLQEKLKAESAIVKPGTKRKAPDSSASSAKESLPQKKHKAFPARPPPPPRAATPPAAGQQKNKNKASSSSTSKTSSKPDTAGSGMGVTQSSRVTLAAPTSISPSLALWAEDNDVSAEAVAEAYGLGLHGDSALQGAATRPNEGLAPGHEQLGKYVGIDCEMVGVGDGGYESALARVSLVDFHGSQVYDSLVRPREPVVDWRTHVTGIGPRDRPRMRPFDEVRAQIAALLSGRIIVGHDLKHDLAALDLEHPHRAIRDTAKFSGFKKYGHGPKPALRVLAREILGLEIQDGQHSSLEDARVAMLLFRRYKSQFDVEHMHKFGEPGPSSQSSKKAASVKKSKKKKKS